MRRLNLVVLPLALLSAIVGANAPAEPATRPTTQSSLVVVSRDAWGSKPQPMPTTRRHVPKLITIHHAGVLWKAGTDPAQNARNLQKFSQNEKKWPDVPYHFMVAPDGRVFEGRDVNYEPDSNTKYPLNGVLNIELMGNFEEQRVSVEQLRATTLLIAKLCRELKLDPATIRGHGDAAQGQTVCPGKDFKRYIDDGTIRAWVEAELRGESAAIEEKPALDGGPTTRIAL